jgi:hypothetical protein
MADVMVELGAEAATTLLVRLRPESLLEAERLRALLRHELLHAADMLDPAFGYSRELPASDSGPSYDNLLRDRYRVVWDATIDGRLCQRGMLDAGAREARRVEFTMALPMLGARAAELFSAWFDGPRPSHAGIVRFILDPAGQGDSPA